MIKCKKCGRSLYGKNKCSHCTNAEESTAWDTYVRSDAGMAEYSSWDSGSSDYSSSSDSGGGDFSGGGGESGGGGASGDW